jgi:hypothetical protein
MVEPWAVALFVALPLLIVAVIAAALRKEHKRLGALRALAADRGWTFARDNPTLTRRWRQPPFGMGCERRAHNVLTGRWQQRPCVAFDYSFKTKSHDQKSASHHQFAVTAVALPAALPALSVTRESFFGRLETALGRQDIELESEDFNRRYRVNADDPRFAYAVLTPRTMDTLLQGDPVAFRIEGSDIVSWYEGSLAVNEIDARLGMLAAVVDGIQPYVWTEFGR